MPALYLAGGFHTKWQDSVRASLPDWTVFDPSSHELLAPHEYTNWDLKAIRRSDFLLAYMERTNPGGYALALEVGYAKALGKKIVLLEEHPTEQRKRYFEMVRQVADYRCESLVDAIECLRHLRDDTT